MNAPTDLSEELKPALDLEGATPVMAQYIQTKAQYPDAILMFRMGEFY